MTIKEIARNQTVQDLLGDDKDLYHKVVCTDGVVWVMKGFNIDRIYNERLGVDFPFSLVIASLICQHVTEGKGLVEISKQEGFPPYHVMLNWKKSRPDFAKELSQAQKAKAEFNAEKAVSAASKGTGDKLYVDTMKWSASAENPEKYAQKTQTKKETLPIKFEIQDKK